MMKMALIGYGRWGRNLARVMDQMGVLGAIVDGSQDSRTEAVGRFPAIPFYSEFSSNCFDELRSRGINAVVISTPADTHVAMVMMALSEGFHTYVEKPMALDYEDAARLVSDASSRGLKLFVGHVFEYHPAFVRLIEMIQSGYLGTVQYVSSIQMGPGRVRDKEDVLFSLAPHDVSMVLRIMGKLPGAVSAHGVSHKAEENRAGTAVIAMDYFSALADVHVSWMSPVKRRQLMVVGSRRTVVFDDIEKKMTSFDRTLDINAYEKDASPVFYDTTVEPIRVEMEAFARYVDDGVMPPTTGDSSLGVIRVLQSARDSIVSRTPVILEG